MNGGKEGHIQVLVGKPEGARPLRIPICMRVCNIKLDRVDTGWADGEWIGLAQDRDKWRALVNAAMNLQVQ
jgi:hypothetical protein